MLDLTNPEVIGFIIGFIDKLLNENNISYIKWDMNRALGECGCAHLDKEEFRSIWYRHVQGFYSIIETLREKHPEVEFEACASGGGRVDFGCMSRFDEFWTSDNTDPIDRLSIQETYSLLYPPKYMRTWITDAADNDNRRVPLSFRAHCAMCGALGIGMDLNRVGGGKLKELAGYVEEYKAIRSVVQFGRLARLKSCHRDDFHALQYDKDGEAVVFVFLTLRSRGKYEYTLKLVNLKEDVLYRFVLDGKEQCLSGSYLMYHGLALRMAADFTSKCIRLQEIK